MKLGISGVVIAYNEAQRIADCVSSLWRVCDEVVVVDSYSTDDTVAISASLGCRVYSHEFEGHIEQKNWAQNQAHYSWILSLDADEVLSEGLVEWLLIKKKQGLNPEENHSNVETSADSTVAWSFPRLNHLSGTPIKGCGWYPDRKIRFWKFGVGIWGGQNPHDRIIIPNELRNGIGKCDFDILHYSYDSFEEIEHQARKFARIGSESLRHRGISKGALIIKLISSPISRWVKNYLLRGGFAYGKSGWVICRWQFHETFQKYWKALINR